MLKRLTIKIFIIYCYKSCFADIDIYGRLAGGIENNVNTSTSQQSSVVADYASYIGIQGSEYIADKSAFIWQLEQFISITAGRSHYISTANGLIVPKDDLENGKLISGVNQIATSDSYIGIQSSWGQIMMGNLSTYLRAEMGAVDIFNYGYGANGLAVWSRTSNNIVLPNSFAYHSSDWHGFTLGMEYSWNNFGYYNNNSVPLFDSGENGNYSGGVYSFGVAWNYQNFKINYGGQLFPNVGSYNNYGEAIANLNYSIPPAATYNNAYINRLELSYDDPYSIFMGVGIQIADGLGWYGWANSGGSFNNYIVNPGFNFSGLAQPEYQTQEFVLSAGYHWGLFTPKIAYAYGNNLMYGGSLGAVLFGNANQIPDSGYQQLALELDFTLSKRMVLFANYGQIWFGNTLHNVSYCGANCNNGNPVGVVNSSNQAFANQSTIATGLSYLF